MDYVAEFRVWVSLLKVDLFGCECGYSKYRDTMQIFFVYLVVPADVILAN